MELTHTEIVKSPIAEHRVRLCGEVTYDDRRIAPELFWFDVPEKCSEFLSTSGNLWLVCLVPLAVSLGEPLHICKPVDSLLFENIHELMHIWKRWYPHLKVVPVRAEVVRSEQRKTPGKTAAFFSGGADSFFTALRHCDGSSAATGFGIDELLHVWGFDIPLRYPEAYQRMHRNLQIAARALGKEVIDVATNLRDTRLEKTGWGPLFNGCALASVALALEKRYSTALIASSFGYADLQPWGSHPLTDPLSSTNETRIVHDGAAFDRVQKIEFIARSEVAMRFLHVCWKSESDKNCGNCHKCYRTMTTLALLGALDRCATFSEARFDVKRVGKFYSYDDRDRSGLKQLQALALQKGRRDISRAIERSFKHSDRIDTFLSIISWFSNKPFVWRYAESASRALLSGSLA